jgi:hypothetical protein
MTASSGSIFCVDCGAIAPETDTAYTLIGARFGWRLRYVPDETGRRVQQWRCLTCYRRDKAAREGNQDK